MRALSAQCLARLRVGVKPQILGPGLVREIEGSAALEKLEGQIEDKV